VPSAFDTTARSPALILLALGVLFLPVYWSGPQTRQAGSESMVLADGVGQTITLDYESPQFLELPASGVIGRRPAPIYQAIVSIPGTRASHSIPIQVIPQDEQFTVSLRIPLLGVHANRGTRIQVVVRDPTRKMWLRVTEYDSYAAGSLAGQPGRSGGDLAFEVVYRRSLFDLALEGIGVAYLHRRLLLAAIAALLPCTLIIARLFRRQRHLDSLALGSLGTSGAVLLTVWIALAAFLVKGRIDRTTVLSATIAGLVISLLVWSRPLPRLGRPTIATTTLAVLLGILALARLGYASSLALPQFSDSIEHYQIIASLLEPSRPSFEAHELTEALGRYYHFGFHLIAAWIFAITGNLTPSDLAVLGQMTQLLVVPAVYFPAYALFADESAALAATILAGFGWSMPGYASNWGKFPAILALVGFSFVAGLLITWSRRRFRGTVVTGGYLLVAGIAATIIHTRTAFLILALVLSIAAFLYFRSCADRLCSQHMWVWVIGITAASVLALATCSGPLQSTASRLADRYLGGQGAPILILLMIALPAGISRFPRQSALIGIFLLVVAFLSLIPPNLPAPYPFIDIPMLEITMFIPLALLGGAALAGISSPRQGSNTLGEDAAPGRALLATLALIYVAWTISPPNEGPSQAGTIAGQDDLSAIAALASRRGPDTLVAIAAASRQDTYLAPVDGGGWIPALALVPTTRLPPDSEMTSPIVHSQLCEEGVTEVFIGSTALSFSRTLLDLYPQYFSPIGILPGAAAYRLEGCTNASVTHADSR